jgi:type IV secretory pathway TrbF-like protein
MVIRSICRRLAVLALFALCLLCLVLVAVLLPYYILRGSDRAWPTIVAVDRLGNAISGGSDRETISSRAYRVQSAEQGRWACVLCRFLGWVTRSEHCKNSSGI